MHEGYFANILPSTAECQRASSQPVASPLKPSIDASDGQAANLHIGISPQGDVSSTRRHLGIVRPSTDTQASHAPILSGGHAVPGQVTLTGWPVVGSPYVGDWRVWLSALEASTKVWRSLHLAHVCEWLSIGRGQIEGVLRLIATGEIFELKG